MGTFSGAAPAASDMDWLSPERGAAFFFELMPKKKSSPSISLLLICSDLRASTTISAICGVVQWVLSFCGSHRVGLPLKMTSRSRSVSWRAGVARRASGQDVRM